jgi:hypothetical protein
VHRGVIKRWDGERTKCEGEGEKKRSVRKGTIQNKKDRREERRGHERRGVCVVWEDRSGTYGTVWYVPLYRSKNGSTWLRSLAGIE